MPTLDDYKGQTPAWCPGCGNFGILKAFKEAFVELGIEPYRFIIVSGIGQAGKFPHYLRCNTFNGLHGRSLPVATGVKLANHEMLVVAEAGDGDCYGEGGNHLIRTYKRAGFSNKHGGDSHEKSTLRRSFGTIQPHGFCSIP